MFVLYQVVVNQQDFIDAPFQIQTLSYTRHRSCFLNQIFHTDSMQFRDFLSCSNDTEVQTLFHLYNGDHKQVTASLVHDVHMAI